MTMTDTTSLEDGRTERCPLCNAQRPGESGAARVCGACGYGWQVDSEGKPMIATEADLLALIGEDTWERADRRFYKETECGGHISMTLKDNRTGQIGEYGDNKPSLFPGRYTLVGVLLSTMVEGSDAEFSHRLYFPFSEQEWEDTVAELEAEADTAWSEANGEE